MGISSGLGPDALQPGLVLVKSQTIGSAVSSVTVSDAFNGTYDNYRISITGGVVSTNGSVFFQLSGITGSVYQVMGYFMSIGIATLNAYAPAATTSWEISSANTNGWSFVADISSPQKTERKFFSSAGGVSAGGVYHFNGYCNSTSSATGFTITHGTGGATFTGGTIRVYGYRN